MSVASTVVRIAALLIALLSVRCAGTPEERAHTAERVQYMAEAARDTARTVGGPFGEIVAVAGGLIAAGAGAYAKSQRARAEEEATKRRSAEQVADTAVLAIEHIPDDGAKKIAKATVRGESLKRGTASVMHAFVQEKVKENGVSAPGKV